MQRLNRRGLLLLVALTGGLLGALIFGASGSPVQTSAASTVAIVQEQPYPPGFEQPHRPIAVQEYQREDGYAPGFEQPHRTAPAWSVPEYPQEEGYAPGFEQSHH